MGAHETQGRSQVEYRCAQGGGFRMNWSSLDEFIAMGGYGLYVWGSYGVTLAVMLFEAFSVRQRHARARAAIGDRTQS